MGAECSLSAITTRFYIPQLRSIQAEALNRGSIVQILVDAQEPDPTQKAGLDRCKRKDYG